MLTIASSFQKAATLLGLTAFLGVPTLTALPPAFAEAHPVNTVKGSVTGNFGTASLECSSDGTYWNLDITLASSRGKVTAYAGTVNSTSGHIRTFAGIVNPPVETVYDQVQIPLSELPPGTYTARATGTGTTFQGVFGIGAPSCSITTI